jgi:hypothetical protein
VIWVQPPGTPAVGEAFLDAFNATGDKFYLEGAREAGEALLRGQLQSGGWYYSISFDAAQRQERFYRLDAQGEPQEVVLPKKKQGLPDGWETWKSNRISGNQTILDDDTTQAAIRFLIRLDAAHKMQDKRLHEAVEYALTSLLAAQYPNGGWSANYDRFPLTLPAEKDYPIVKASYPESWAKMWPKDFRGCYVTNDNLMADCIDTLLLAAETYSEARFLQAARRAGDFLLLAQMPDPQPAWAQQYDAAMQPTWSRAFEPPAISGGESQGILRALLTLYQHTGDAKYLEPIPRALAYLRKSTLADGRLARFYELKSNQPIYFTRDAEGRHQPTYDETKITTGYGYIFDNKLENLATEYERVRKLLPEKLRPSGKSRPGHASASLVAATKSVLAALDERGAWVEKGRLAHHKIAPESGVIQSATFAKNVRTLSKYLAAGDN